MDESHLKTTREWMHHSSIQRNGLASSSGDQKQHYFVPQPDEDENEDTFLTREELTNPVELAKAVKTRLPLYVPIVKWIRQYSRQDLIGDILSSITVATMLVPQALAYAILAGVPPIYGLYSGWLPLVIYAFMGSCKQLAVGPEALLSVLLGTLLVGSNEEDKAEYAHSLAFLVGVVSFLFGILQFGFMGSIISRWVLSGFINAVALIIAISQLEALLGLEPGKKTQAHDLEALLGSSSGQETQPHDGPYQKFWYAITHLGSANKATIIFSVGCIVFLFGMRIVKMILAKRGFKYAKYIPDIMLVVVISILITKFGELESHGVAAIGDIDGGFPIPRFPKFDLEELRAMLPEAFLIVIIGFVEATAVSKGLATKHNYSISSNRELVAFGTANILGSIFKTYPVFASIPRTSIQDSSGSRTCLSGFLTSCLLLFTCLFLTGLFYHLPKCTMASIIFVAAFGLLELHEVVFLWKTRSWGDLVQFMVALLATFILEVEIGILISVGMCIFLVLKHSSSPHVYSVLGRVPGTNRFKDVSKFPEAEPIEGILLIRIDEVLYFANISQFKQLLAEIERMMDKSAMEAGNGGTPLQSIIINIVNIPVVDASALLTLQEMVEAYHKRNIKVSFVQMSEKIKDSFKKSGLYDLITPQLIFDSNYEAVTYLEHNSNQNANDLSVDIPTTRGAFDQDEEDYTPSSPGAIIADGIRMDDFSDPDSDEFITKK
ncbi:Sulfate transporter [Heterostelium album PN500]|uniref:Sulfate transporter n=1 Tax=Heterostelium pallidum (strain ATCC 26659 / Pp 5 / PN500) TaxID=670386 RepID=D3BRS8_HETP5|nr:Sulfate transporter [Heterostelium album PN500]EFA76110.1 Sulfate transporter [Heterostelium album PN500]|eukprot:XP_020428244.1 Sulfate transporter [Heterostelium album PN500]